MEAQLGYYLAFNALYKLNSSTILRIVAGFGGDVIINGPDSVRSAYREYLQKQLELYNSEAK